MRTRKRLATIIAVALALCGGKALAQASPEAEPRPPQAASAPADGAASKAIGNPKKPVVQLERVTLTGSRAPLGAGLLKVQEAPQGISTVTRDALEKGAPAGTFVHALESIPGMITTSDDAAGLGSGNFTLRGFKDDEVGVTLNGVPINDSGNYRVNATLFSDADNIDHITVQQGWASVDMPVSSAAGGSVAWVTLDPSRRAGFDVNQGFGGNRFRRTFVRANTGDIGPLRAWISYANSKDHLWSGFGTSQVDKVEAKALWTIDAANAVAVSFLHSQQINNSFLPLTTSQAAVRYDQGYSNIWTVPQNLASTKTSACNPTVAYNACYYKLHATPFRNWLLSADARFTLSDRLHLSVVPYFEYKGGGVASQAKAFQETTDNTLFRYGYVNGDLNGDGIVKDGDQASVYVNSVAYTWRPGIVVKLTRTFGDVDTLNVGFWLERPREKQDGFVSKVDGATGTPADIWTRHDVIRYPSGQPMQSFNESTTTLTQKFFASNIWTPNNRWSLTTALAYTRVRRSGYEHDYYFATSGPDYMQGFGADFDGTYRAWTPSVGLKFQLDDAHQFYLASARTLRPPVNSALAQNTAADVFNAIHGNVGAFSAVNKPETSTIVDAGWRYYAPRASASVNAYVARFRNKTVQGYDAKSDETVITDLPGVHMHGINAETSFKLNSAWTAYGSYAYTVARQQTDLNAGDKGVFPTRGKTLTNVPRSAAFLRLAYQEGPAWANLSARYRGSIYGDWSNQQKVGGYTRADLGVGYNFRDLSAHARNPSIKLNIFNLTNRRAFAWASNSPFSNTAGPDTYSMLQPRTVMVTFGLSLL